MLVETVALTDLDLYTILASSEVGVGSHVPLKRVGARGLSEVNVGISCEKG